MATVATKVIKYVHQPQDSVVYTLSVPNSVILKKKDGTYDPATITWSVMRSDGDSQSAITTAAGLLPFGLTIRTMYFEYGGSAPYYLDDNQFSISTTNRRLVYIYLFKDNVKLDSKSVTLQEEGKDGDTGAQGVRGPSLRGPRDWSALANGTEFLSGDQNSDGTYQAYIDVVRYNGNYYYCKQKHTKSILAMVVPGATNSAYWTLGDKFDLVATKLFLADDAWVKNLQVSNLHSYENETTGTGAHLWIHQGVLELFESECATPSIRIGVVNGIPVIQFYDTEGNLLYDLGPSGINQIRETASDTWTPLYLRLLTSDTSKTLEYVTRTYVSTYKNCAKTDTAYQFRCMCGQHTEWSGLYFRITNAQSDYYIADGWYCLSQQTGNFTGMPAPLSFGTINSDMTQTQTSSSNRYMTYLYRFTEGMISGPYPVYWET